MKPKQERPRWPPEAWRVAVGWWVGLGMLPMTLRTKQALAASPRETAEGEVVREESWAAVRATANGLLEFQHLQFWVF